MDGSNPGADWAFSNLKLAFPCNQSRMSDFHPFDVGDGVVIAWCAVEGNSQISRTRFGFCDEGCSQKKERNNKLKITQS